MTPWAIVTHRVIRYIDWARWLGILIVSTVVMRGARRDRDQAHASFVYILTVVADTTGGER